MDTHWLRTYSGRVYQGIEKLHYDPKSYVNMLDRIYMDLMPQFVDAPSKQ